MPGGMNKRGRYGAMADRVARSTGDVDERADVQTLAPPEHLKHVWVTDRHGRLPGLLLEWRNIDGVWDGRVVHAVQEDDGWALVEEWLPAGLLDPVRAD